MLNFQEDLLHYVWRFQYFNQIDLQTVQGERFQILHPGQPNENSGPDFTAASIRTDDLDWTGNVEIHLLSSDWYKHHHEEDPAYDNIILHVVYQNDREVFRRDGSIIPTLELKGRISGSVFDRYWRLKANNQWVPCSTLAGEVSNITRLLWLENLAVERLQERSRELEMLLNFTDRNWEYTLFIQMGRYFGGRVNKVAFEALCKRISLDQVYKNHNDPFILEALFFGVAGMLDRPFQDNYPNQLKKEFRHLSKKYDLQPIDPKLWKFFRLRPQNFPTIRIAQWVAFIAGHQRIFSKIMAADNIDELKSLFKLEINAYWEDHFVFDKSSVKISKHPGEEFADAILINAVLPFLFFYGKNRKETILLEKATDLLMAIKPESNKITRGWKSIGWNGSNAMETQGLLQLKTRYCDHHRCLQCAIGHQIMKINNEHSVEIGRIT